MDTKPRNHPFKQLKPYIDEYWSESAHGDPKLLSFTALAEYAASRMGETVFDRDFSRNPETRDYIDKLKSGEIVLPGMPPVSNYKCKSAEQIAKIARDYSLSVQTLQELDHKCRDNVDELNRIRNLMMEKDRKIDELEQTVALLKSQLESLSKPDTASRQCQRQLGSYRSFVNEYVRQEIAQALYAESQNKELTARTFQTEKWKALFEGPKPMPVTQETKPDDVKGGGNPIIHLIDYINDNA